MRDFLRRAFGRHWWVVGYRGVLGPMKFIRARQFSNPPWISGYVWSRTKPKVVYEDAPVPVMEWTKDQLDQWLRDHPLPTISEWTISEPE